MGLTLEVGILADLKGNDADGFEVHSAALERLSAHLVSLGLPPHVEPTDVAVWSAEMIGYTGLQNVRRIAAYLDCDQPLPAPSQRDAAKDPYLEGYYAELEGKLSNALKRLVGSAPQYRRQFDHLIEHGDAEGYYLPIDFPKVLYLSKELRVPGGMVGSVPRLAAELDRIARVLEIPDALAADSEELWQASDSPPADGPLWKRYGRESFGCVVLREGCRRAMAANAALVFT
jgi:hypothetical protein